MGWAFDTAGFDAVDVHMTDLLSGRVDLAQVQGLVAVGGFSYGDVLGAGEGWARTIRFNSKLSDQFAAYFARPDSFALGVCNGCQMMAALAPMIPGAEHWPRFTRNLSEKYEARLSMVELAKSPSIFFAGMEGSRIPVAVAHGEGFADFSQQGDAGRVLAAARYIDSRGNATEAYPFNPNWQPGRPDVRHHRRRPLHRDDAAPGTRDPQRHDVVGPREVGQRRQRRPVQPVDAHLPQRARLAEIGSAPTRRASRLLPPEGRPGGEAAILGGLTQKAPPETVGLFSCAAVFRTGTSPARSRCAGCPGSNRSGPSTSPGNPCRTGWWR